MSAPEARFVIMNMPQTVRFLIAGGGAALLNWLVRFPLSLALPYAGAVIVANVIGMVFGFVAYRHFVFCGSKRLPGHQLRDFIAVNLFSTAVVVAVSVVFAEYLLPSLGFQWQVEAISHAVGISAGAVSNFLGHRQFSFARN